MKRSEINKALRELEAMCEKHCCYLPPFCHFTPEQWENIGHEYDEVDYQTVVRILDGVVFQEKKKPVGKKKRKATPDSYAWTREKVENLIANGQTKPIGIGSPEGILNMSALLNTIKSEKDKMVLAKTFARSERKQQPVFKLVAQGRILYASEEF